VDGVARRIALHFLGVSSTTWARSDPPEKPALRRTAPPTPSAPITTLASIDSPLASVRVTPSAWCRSSFTAAPSRRATPRATTAWARL